MLLSIAAAEAAFVLFFIPGEIAGGLALGESPLWLVFLVVLFCIGEATAAFVAGKMVVRVATLATTSAIGVPFFAVQKIMPMQTQYDSREPGAALGLAIFFFAFMLFGVPEAAVCGCAAG